MIFAGIVTYQPDLNRLGDNLRAVSPQVRKVIIYDNGSTNIESSVVT
jgi:rhamnosyltransferase